MFTLFVLLMVISLGLFGWHRWIKGDPKERQIDGAQYMSMASGVAGGLAILCLLLSTFYVIDPGEVGLEILFGRVVEYSENGIHAKNPLASIEEFDIKTIKEDHKTEGTSQDLQLIIVECAIQYRIDFTKIGDLYSKVGTSYTEKIINPGIQDAVKASTALFGVEKIVVERAKLKDTIEAMLREKMERFYLVLQDFQITDIDFSPEFNKVVEEKQLEEQRIKTAEYRRQQAMKDKETSILQAQAESEKQRLLRSTTSKEVIDLKWIEKWNGQLPTYMMGNSIPMVNMKAGD